MLKTLFLIFASFILVNTFSQSVPDVLGIWCSGKKDCKVQLYKNGNTIEGKIVWLLEDKDENGKPVVDYRNPDPALRNHPMVGKKILWNATYNPDTDFFENGTAYVKGREFCGKFKLNPDGTLSVTGYICSLSFLHKTDTWTKVP